MSETAEPSILVLRSLQALAEWQGEWDRLWAARSGGTVFQHFAWAEAWIKSFGERGEMRVVVASDGQRSARARAILPMWVTESGEFHLIGEPSSDYHDIVCDAKEIDIDSVLRSMLIDLIDSRPGWTRIRFNELREDSILLRALRRLASENKLPFPWCEQLASRCPVVESGGQGAVFANFLRKKSLRRHYNRMSKMSGFRYRRIESPDEAQAVLNSLIDQHVARWAINGIPSLFADPRNVEFYRELLASPAFFPFIHFTVVEVEGRPIATHVGFLHHGIFVWYKPAFDPNYDRMSPGEVLMFCLFREFHESGLVEFDFTRGEESFKSRFATGVRQSHSFFAFASAADRAIFSLLGRLRDPTENKGAIGLASAVLTPVFRVMRHVKTNLGNGAYRRLGQRLRKMFAPADRNALVFGHDGTGTLPTAPEGLEVSFGAIDLLDLGKMSLLQPDYLSSARLKKAVMRKKRGDRVLVIKNSAGVPVHVSWLRSAEDGVTIEGSDKRLAIGGDDVAEIISDFWTDAQTGQSGLDAWALRYLANQIAREGREAWLYCMSGDLSSRRAAEKAGFTLRETIPCA